MSGFEYAWPAIVDLADSFPGAWSAGNRRDLFIAAAIPELVRRPPRTPEKVENLSYRIAIWAVRIADDIIEVERRNAEYRDKKAADDTQQGDRDDDGSPF